MADIVAIDGLEDVQRMLADSARQMAEVALPPALQAGIDVLSEEVAIRTPRDHSGRPKEFPPLTDSLRTEVEVDPERLRGQATVGFGDQGFKAAWVEYGHRAVTHDGKDTGIQVPPHPFMRPAFDSASDRAIEAFHESYADTVRKEYQS